MFSVCTIPDQRPSLRRDQRPGQMGFSPSRTTTSPTGYFQESRVAVQHPFPIMYYYNVVPRHLSSNSIDLNFLLFWRRSYNDVLRSTLHRYDVASPPAVRHICSTVEPLTNDHPHQRPSLSYDHISCDGQWFLFIYESDRTNVILRVVV